MPVRLRATSTDELAESTFVGPKVAGGWGHAVVIDGVRRTPAGPVFQVRDPWETWVKVNGHTRRSGGAALPKELTKAEFEAAYRKWLNVIEVIGPPIRGNRAEP